MRALFRFSLFSIAVAAATACSPGRANSQAVALPDPNTDIAEATASSAKPAVAVFAGGCFWGVEAVFESLKGVGLVTSGYAGARPSRLPVTYDDVGTGRTGFAESVRVEYDPSKISYGQLLKVFFSVAHDPTQLNRQGPDVGTQYRSAIFYANDEQKRLAQAYIVQLDAAKAFPRPIVTQVKPLTRFYQAEDYHQDYMRLHPNQPYIVHHDRPKLENLKRQFPQLVKGG
jgi:peptide-methionine (S)-S-oxide reductase